MTWGSYGKPWVILHLIKFDLKCGTLHSPSVRPVFTGITNDSTCRNRIKRETAWSAFIADDPSSPSVRSFSSDDYVATHAGTAIGEKHLQLKRHGIETDSGLPQLQWITHSDRRDLVVECRDGRAVVA